MSRIRANQITNQSADGAPTVQNGLVISGVTTSTTFSGSGASLTNIPSAQLTGALPALDGSNLTNITSTTINNNGSNRIITGSGTANTLEGEATFTYDGTSVAKIDTSQTYATFQLDGSAGGAIEFYENGTRRFELYGIDAEVALYDRDKGAYHTRFKSGGNVEISDGKLLIGTTTKGVSNADDLTIATSSDTGITIRSGSSSSGRLFFSDGTSGTDEYTGGFEYAHNDNSMRFFTNGGNERLRIDSNGYVTTKSELWVGGSAPVLRWRDSTHGEKATARISGSDLYFEVANNERLRINSSGYITKPNQPMCSYDLNSSIQSGNYIIHNNVHTNNGTHYNTGNGRFVCPVAGYYYASIMAMTNNSSTQLDIELHKNGSNPNNILVPYNQSGGTYNQVAGSCIIYCAANDYLQFKLNSGSVYNGRHGNVSFALLA